MANQLATCSVVAKEALAILENMLTFSANVNRDYEAEFTENMNRGYAPGQTIQIKKPPRYQYRAGRVAAPQATVEPTIPLTLQQGGCDLQFTAAERTLSVTRLEDKIAAAVAVVANEIDRQGLALAHYSTFNCPEPDRRRTEHAGHWQSRRHDRPERPPGRNGRAARQGPAHLHRRTAPARQHGARAWPACSTRARRSASRTTAACWSLRSA
jgi:hypothetical protein